MNINILLGPKLGDLFHMLVVPQYYYRIFGKKSNLYLCERHDKFTTGLKDTYESLKPILDRQKFTNTFEIYDPLKHKIDIDLNAFRWNGVWCNRPYWAVFLHTAFPNRPTIPKNFACIEWDKNTDYSEHLIVHRKEFFDFNEFVEKQYRHVFDQFEKKLFLTYDIKVYESFPLKDLIEPLVVPSLSEQLSIINGCKMNMYNCTGTLCMASVLNAPRIGEAGEWLNNAYGFDHLFFDNVEIFDKEQVFNPVTKYLIK